MQSTTKEQITLLTDMLDRMSVITGKENEVFLAARFPLSDRQTLNDAVDTLVSLKAINFEEIKSEFQTNYGPVGGGEDAIKYLRIVGALDLLIETFKD